MSENGRLVVPVAFRDAMGLKGGEDLLLSLDENGLHIQAQRQLLERAQAMVREFIKPGQSLADELIAERRLEANSRPKLSTADDPGCFRDASGYPSGTR